MEFHPGDTRKVGCQHRYENVDTRSTVGCPRDARSLQVAFDDDLFGEGSNQFRVSFSIRNHARDHAPMLGDDEPILGQRFEQTIRAGRKSGYPMLRKNAEGGLKLT